MKNEYMIKELARLYGVGTDTLRYYERLGLIRPRRGENGYRLYSLRDIYRLTIIRDLRQLGFSTDRISAYLDDLSIGNTQALLTEEQQLIRQRIKQLRQIDRAISERQKHLKQYAALPAGEISVRPVSERPCLLFNTDISRDEEVDFAIKKLHNRHADTIRDLGGQAIGAGMRLDEVRAGRFGWSRVRQSTTCCCPAENMPAWSIPAATAPRRFMPNGYWKKSRGGGCTLREICWSCITSTTAIP